MTGIREELERKLNNLSTEQLNSVRQFVDSLEPQTPQENSEYPVTNEDIDRVIESYRQQNKPLPIGLAKGEFTVPDDFNDIPLLHKDPFDRLIIAQSLQQDLIIMTEDRLILAYPNILLLQPGKQP